MSRFRHTPAPCHSEALHAIRSINTLLSNMTSQRTAMKRRLYACLGAINCLRLQMAPPFFLKHVTEKNKVGQSADRILPVFYLILYNNFTKGLSILICFYLTRIKQCIFGVLRLNPTNCGYKLFLQAESKAMFSVYSIYLFFLMNFIILYIENWNSFCDALVTQ